MNADAETRQRIQALRNPLARIELAAGQLLREVATPAAREQAERVLDAVGALDRDIAGLDVALFPRGAVSDRVDVRAALEKLHGRLAPALAARGIAWDAPAGEAAFVQTDPEWLRRVCVELVRTLAGASEGETALWVEVVQRDTGIELVGRARPGPAEATSPAVLAELRGLVGQHAGSLEADVNPEQQRVVVRIGATP